MKELTWNLHALWNTIKLVATRNLWLKIVAFLLAFATYSALKDKTKYTPSNVAKDDTRLYETLREYMKNPNTSREIENRPVLKLDKPLKEQ